MAGLEGGTPLVFHDGTLGARIDFPPFIDAAAARGLRFVSYSRPDDESVRALVARIERFVREWSEGATPFVWVETADEILAKAIRKPQETSGAGH